MANTVQESVSLEGEVTADGRLVVTLPPNVPRGRVRITLELASPEPELVDQGFPVFAVSPNSKPITLDMVQRALEEA
jgi:hypothetical protein